MDRHKYACVCVHVCVCVTISIAKMESKFSDSERVLNKRRVYQRE